jgi:hypothetical protein
MLVDHLAREKDAKIYTPFYLTSDKTGPFLLHE